MNVHYIFDVVKESVVIIPNPTNDHFIVSKPMTNQDFKDFFTELEQGELSEYTLTEL